MTFLVCSRVNTPYKVNEYFQRITGVDNMKAIPSKNEAIQILLNRNIEEWNDIREKKPKWIPDLRGASFKNRNFERPDLDDDEVYVKERSHWGANLKGAMLQDTNFDGAKLAYVDFEGSSMRASSFKGAQLYRTNFTDTRLNSANFEDARFEYTNFENADLSGIKFNKKSRYRGIRVSTSYGNVEFRRFAQDQDFLEEFREKNLWCRIVLWVTQNPVAVIEVAMKLHESNGHKSVKPRVGHYLYDLVESLKLNSFF